MIDSIYKTQNEFYIKGQEIERESIAKDLHDSTSGILFGIKLQLESIKINHQNLNPIITELEKQIDNVTDEIRSITKKISPTSLQNFGLLSAIENYLKDPIFKTTEININSNIGIRRFNRDTEINLFRIIQECLNNAIKHSKTKKVDVTLTLEDNQLFIEIKDYGTGLSVKNKNEGHGLSNIYIRAQIINALIDIYSQSGIGMCVQIKVKV